MPPATHAAVWARAAKAVAAAEAGTPTQAQPVGAARKGSGHVKMVVLEGPVPASSASDDDEDDEQPSVSEQLTEIAQMLRTMQFDISALKRTNRRQ